MKTTTIALWTLCGMAGLLAGCGGNYYKVNDPAGDRQYYTTDIDQSKAGAITFKDEKSGSKVTLQSSEVKEISEDEFDVGGEARRENDQITLATTRDEAAHLNWLGAPRRTGGGDSEPVFGITTLFCSIHCS